MLGFHFLFISKKQPSPLNLSDFCLYYLAFKNLILFSLYNSSKPNFSFTLDLHYFLKPQTNWVMFFSCLNSLYLIFSQWRITVLRYATSVIFITYVASAHVMTPSLFSLSVYSFIKILKQ